MAREPSEAVTMIGEECDLVGIKSPFSYITKTKTLAFRIKVESFMKELLRLNPNGLMQLKTAAAKKLNHFTQLVREKK